MERIHFHRLNSVLTCRFGESWESSVKYLSVPKSTHIIKNGPVAQLVSAPPCHGGGRGFKSRQGRGNLRVSGQIAQSVEHTPEKCGVASSILALATIMAPRKRGHFCLVWAHGTRYCTPDR